MLVLPKVFLKAAGEPQSLKCVIDISFVSRKDAKIEKFAKSEKSIAKNT
jgi:hypothetical protein